MKMTAAKPAAVIFGVWVILLQSKTKIKTGIKETAFPALRIVFHNFFEHDVGKNAAALAYYLLFAIFPLLIFLSNLLGLLDLNIHAITQTLQQFLPNDIVDIVESYLDYVSNSSSHSLLWFTLVFSVWFPMRAAKGLMNDVRLAYRLGKPQKPVVYTIRRFIYTIVLLLVFSLTLILSTLGEHVLRYINQVFLQVPLHISETIFSLWQFMRFVPMALLMLAAIGGLYSASLDKLPGLKEILPGILAALISWLLLSICFSFYVERFANYSVIYGTLGAVIVLMLWLYMTAIILILGAELNAALAEIKLAASCIS